jgi:hypothetical protein
MNYEYDNYFSWTSRISDLITKIEDLNEGVKVNSSNYRDIFENLDKYLKIDDVILNTDIHPFLESAIKGAVNFPEHDFKIIFSDLLTKKDLKSYKLCDSENKCKLDQIRKEIFGGLSKFFEKVDHDFDEALTKSLPEYNHNLHFVNYEDVLDKAFVKFSEFNSSEENLEDLINSFKEKIEKYKTFKSKIPAYDIAFKVDLGKVLGVFDSEKNIIAHDFDQGKYFEANIDEDYVDFPKVSLVKFDYYPDKSYNALICAFGINYFPKALEKMYLVLFEHIIDKSGGDKFIGLEDSLKSNFVYTETNLEILFEYIISKNFETNEEIKDFFEKITYQDLYDDFDEFYSAHIRKAPSEVYAKDFRDAHFFSGPLEKMHLMNDETGLPIHHFWYCNNSDDFEKSATWARSSKASESMSGGKRDIFEQIKNNPSFM